MISNHPNATILSEKGLLTIITAYIKQDCGRFHNYIVENGRRRRVSRTEYNVNREDDLWRTPWGTMLADDSLRYNNSQASRKFRRRFRVSFSMFLYVVRRCEAARIFGNTKIPYEFRILIGLRILGRGNCADDIFELSGIAESTVNYIFHQFTSAFVENFYDEFISFPQDEELERVTRTYEELGFPGACGSMDATHVRLHKCPHGLRVLATGMSPCFECYYCDCTMLLLFGCMFYCVRA